MSTPPPHQSAGDSKKTPPTSIVTRNGARKAKIQTRAMSAGAKPSASVVAAKRKAQQKKKSTVDTVIRDHYQIAMECKTKVRGPIGLVTEPRMAEHCCLWDDKYPECPERLIGVIERCKELNLIEQCKTIDPRPATQEELAALHSPSVYEMLQKTHQNQDLAYLEDISSKFDAIYIHPSTHELALLAAGSTIELVSRVASGELQAGAALVRPPGHHAMRAEPCGYCFYNNVALAARHALDSHGLSRILIVDWDVHHGQATQQMFYDDPRVLYFSIHRYEHGRFWPSLRQAEFSYVGAGRGAGRTCNVPLNHTGMRDADYLAVFHHLLLPMAIEYQPELIIISAGYDAAIGCPEFSPELIIVSAGYDSALGDEKGEMEVSPACYATLVHQVAGVCPAVCAVLEGGYCVPALAEGAALTLRSLLHHPPPVLPNLGEPSDSIRETILNCIYAQRPYWRCFNIQPTYSVGSVPNVCDGDKDKHTVVVRWEGDETRPERFATRDCYPLQDNETKRQILAKLDHLRIVTDLSIAQHPVCYIYDQAMLKHKNICEPDHVECPERIMRIHERHRDFALLPRLRHVPARAATDHEILAVHTEQYLQRLKKLSSTKLRELQSAKEAYDSVYFHPDSLHSAAVASGCVLQMVDTVLTGVGGCGVCVVRPPGHHADEDAPSGFCLLNNAALAAAHAVRDHGLKRVLLLDWDVHHGNGTQRITYEDDQILYISIHRYDNGSFFPHSRDADYNAVGAGRGEGFNVNIPWNARGMGDTEYMAAFTQVVLPIAYEYCPELVIVSAGFDAAVGDPLGGCKVTPECYARMTHFLRGLAGGKIILCLEGGYNVTSISYAMTLCTKALLGDPIPHHHDSRPCHPSAVESIRNVVKTHKKYWKSLKFHVAVPHDDVLGDPAPSRGLDIEKFDLSTTLDDKSSTSLENNMANLSLDKRCSDGIHCGTDDESTSESSPNHQKPSPSENSKAKCSNEPPCGSKNEPSCSRQESKPQTLVDYLSENMAAIANGDMFAVVPLTWCPHLDTLSEIPSSVQFEQSAKCVECDHVGENWVCLHCYITACGRHVRGHMQAHYGGTGHALSLSLADLSAWCSACDAYLDSPRLYRARNNAHRHKFGEDMPWCYPEHVLRLE